MDLNTLYIEQKASSESSPPPPTEMKKRQSVVSDLFKEALVIMKERSIIKGNNNLRLQDVISTILRQKDPESSKEIESQEASEREPMFDLNKEADHQEQPTLSLAMLLMQKKGIVRIDETINEMQSNFDKIRIEECHYTKDTVFHKEQVIATQNVLNAIHLRDQYKFASTVNEVPGDTNDFIEYDKHGDPFIDWKKKQAVILPKIENITFSDQEGYIQFAINGEEPEEFKKIPTIIDYMEDIFYINDTITNKVNKTICQERISMLKQRFQMHSTINNAKELIDQKQIWGRDFYNTLKVDNHIHHSAAMNAQHLLRFIIQKLETEGDVEVTIDQETKKPLTLTQVFAKFDISKDKISLDSLDVKADRTIYQRFDNFNNKYNPMGQPVFREIFMKTENFIQGRYLAELTQEMILKAEQDGYVYTEWRLSIYGKNQNEWSKLAGWVQKNKLQSKTNRWMIQIPRLYAVYKKAGFIQNFQQMMDNIFKPLFEVTADPSKDPDLYQFLRTIGAFDTVDDESSSEHFLVDDLKTVPLEFNKEQNPHYAYWIYYFYTNLTSLNILRKRRNLNTFRFRPHCGEAGNIDHLICSFLLSDGINHGIMLEKNPVLLYFYFLKQIGVSMSPLSNNKLFLKYSKSPFFDFFKMGINITLSTDDPLILHVTNDPLLEEYSIASQIWDLSSVDQAELARNSVKQSSFEKTIKIHWAGDYAAPGASGNRPKYSNLPQSRFIYRLETLLGEFKFLHSFGNE